MLRRRRRHYFPQAGATDHRFSGRHNRRPSNRENDRDNPCWEIPGDCCWPVSTVVPSRSAEGISSSADETGEAGDGVAVGVGVVLMDDPCDESSKSGTNENVRFRGGRLDLRNAEGAGACVGCTDTGGGGTGIL